MLIYNAILCVFDGFVKAVGRLVRQRRPRKFVRFARGRNSLIQHIGETYSKDGRPTVWIHSSSFGEFSVARPMISAFRQQGMQVVATFFSPSGYEAVAGKGDVDHVYYLPIDTAANARALLDIIRPDKAVFIVSEYWFNYLSELRRRGIDTYLVSAKITKKSIFFKPYGFMYRRCLKAYRHIFVIDERSKANLESLGYNDVSVIGNPLFDNAIEKSLTPWTDDKIERFVNGTDAFIAGSIHMDRDLSMVTALADRHPDTRFIIVPHEPGPASTHKISSAVRGKAVAYTQCRDLDELDTAQVLIIDYVGALAYIYRYGKWAYIGGGFTRYLHSLIEATVYGLPVSFGPEIHRKVTPEQMVTLGIGEIVTDADSLDKWFTRLKNDPARYDRISEKARRYVAQSAGSTERIVSQILK